MRPLRLLTIVLVLTTAGFTADWPPINPADLARTTPKLDPDANAEMLLWDVRLDNSSGLTLVVKEHRRIKIYNERGRDGQATFTFTSSPNVTIGGIEGRTIQPDGTILELDADAVQDREIVSAGNTAVTSKTIVLPGVVPGSIVEYRWSELRLSTSLQWYRVYFQGYVPIWEVAYHIKPFGSLGELSLQHFHVNPTPFVVENGWAVTRAHNMPALRTEPFMPPRDEVIAWGLTHYSAIGNWESVAETNGKAYRKRVQTKGIIRETALEVSSDGSTPEEKLTLLADYVRSTIRNVDDPRSGLTGEERRKLNVNKAPIQTLRQRAGNSLDVNLVFGSMASAIGFDAYPAMIADREDHFFRKELFTPSFLQHTVIAVRADGRWLFFDPGSPNVTPGMLDWRYEGVDALICLPDGYEFAPTPISPPERSLVRQVAHIELQDNGTVEGDVEITYSGQAEFRERSSLGTVSQEFFRERMVDAVKKQTGAAEVSDIVVDNATNRLEPLRYTFHIRAPGNAERVGDRLVLQPSFFRRLSEPLLTSSERYYPIYIQYPNAEQNDVTISLPPGFVPDEFDDPVSFPISEAGLYEANLTYQPDDHALRYEHRFDMGRNSRLLVPLGEYPEFKRTSDMIHEQDRYSVVLHREAR